MATAVPPSVPPPLLQSFQLLPVPSATLTDRSVVYKRACQLNAEFISLLQKTISTLQSCQHVNFETVIEFIQVHLRTLCSPLSPQAYSSLQSDVTSESSSFSDLPRLLESLVSWFNYDLMDTLTALFAVREVPEARLGWKAYREKIKELGMIGLGEISIVCLPFGKREAHNFFQLDVTFSFSCLQLLLHNVHHMKKTVAAALGRPSCPLYLTTITQCHGLQLCFLLPRFLYSEVFPLGEEKLEILRDAGVLMVKCQEHRYLLSKVGYCDTFTSSPSCLTILCIVQYVCIRKTHGRSGFKYIVA